MRGSKRSSATVHRARYPGARGSSSPAKSSRSVYKHPAMSSRHRSTRERLDLMASPSPTAFLLQSWIVCVAILTVVIIVLIWFLTIG